MMLAHFLRTSVAAATMLWCSELMAETQELVDDVDFIRSANGREVRVVLSSAGAARIDFKRAADHALSSRTILVPLDDPRKVVQIAKTIATLIDASVDVTEARWSGFGPDEVLVIHCRLAPDNKVRTIRMRQRDLTVNPVWRGVVEEIEMVGSVRLAAAIDEFQCGESHLAKGEHERAVAAYQCAVTTLEEWEKANLLRFGGPTATYEPEVWIKFKYPHRERGDWVVVSGVPRNVMELPGITLDWAVKLLRHGWNKHSDIARLNVSQSEHVFIVAWKELREVGKEHRVLCPGVSIPSPVVDAIRKLP